MASRSKRRAVGNGVPRPPGAPVQRDEQEEEDEVEDEDEDEEDSDEEEDEDDEIVDEEVNIDFEAYSISDNDYDGIKKLLQQLFLKAPVNTAELTDLLIQQNHVGSVIKQTDVSEDSDDDMDEDEIFGFISLLNLTERKGTPCAEQIKELILSCCEKSCEKSVVEQLDALLQDASKPVGFLLSERLINVPPQIALPMHQQLHQTETEPFHPLVHPTQECPQQPGVWNSGGQQEPKDISGHLPPPLVPSGRKLDWKWRLQCGGSCPSRNSAAAPNAWPRKELAEAHKTNKPCGKCCFYLLISKTFVEAGKGSSKKKRSSQKKEELMFANAEEEFFYEKAVLKFSYSVQEDSDTCLGGRWSFDDVPMKPMRTVMVIPGDKMDEIMDKLKDHLSV